MARRWSSHHAPGNVPPPSAPPRIQQRSKRCKESNIVANVELEEDAPSLNIFKLPSTGKIQSTSQTTASPGKRQSTSQSTVFLTTSRKNPSNNQKSTSIMASIKITSVNLAPNKELGDWYSAIYAVSYTTKDLTRSMVRTSITHWQSQDRTTQQ